MHGPYSAMITQQGYKSACCSGIQSKEPLRKHYNDRVQKCSVLYCGIGSMCAQPGWGLSLAWLVGWDADVAATLKHQVEQLRLNSTSMHTPTGQIWLAC